MATDDGNEVEKVQDRLICLKCGKQVLVKASNTTNLFKHLREHHPLIYAEVVAKKLPKWGESSQLGPSTATQAMLGELVAKSAMNNPSSPQVKWLSMAATYHTAKDVVPLSALDKPGFQLMVSTLNLRFKLPSRKQCTEYEITHLYSHVRDNVVLPKLKEALFSLLLLTCEQALLMNCT